MAVSTKTRGNGAVPRAVATLAAVAPARRRRPMWMVGGGVVVVLCATLGALAGGAVDHRRPVVVVTRTVQPGETVTAGDVGFARVAGTGLATVSSEASVVGMVATGRLPAGSPVVPGELVAPSAVAANTVELPMALKAGLFPPGLAVGDQVLLVATTPASALATGPVAPVAAQVSSVVADNSFGSSGSTTVTVTVPRAALAGLADAAAAGQVLIAQVGS